MNVQIYFFNIIITQQARYVQYCFLNLVKSNPIWIVITFLFLLRHQTEFFWWQIDLKSVITIKIRFDSTRFGKRFLGERFFTVQLCMLTEIDFAVLFDLTVCDCIDHFPFDLRSLLLSKQKRKIDNAITVRSI